MVNKNEIFRCLEMVPDPELPFLNVIEMGIVRDVQICDNAFVVEVTPTYSGCPAMKTIELDISKALQDQGYKNFEIKIVLSPAWTTNWLTPTAKYKLEQNGIAPPLAENMDKKALLNVDRSVACPRCKSNATKMISPFGSTACKALYKCIDCLEPFDYFKCI
jgi:ring-1,2-phenylacetyl-CoA epoxidase subunit PaaD